MSFSYEATCWIEDAWRSFCKVRETRYKAVSTVSLHNSRNWRRDMSMGIAKIGDSSYVSQWRE
jgi:hypothetical protein